MRKIEITVNLHTFNPDHEIALAAHLEHFTPPHAARQLMADLGFLPAIWATSDDCVLVGDVAFAQQAWRKLSARLAVHQTPAFVTADSQLLSQVDGVEPWGWNVALRNRLQRAGVNPQVMPAVDRLERLRQLAHRRSAATLLSQLRIEGTVGEAMECSQLEQVTECMARWKRVVAKAPWSSSGRGVRFLSETPNVQEQGWLRNVMRQQGSVMIEPYYKKVKDFGMEFVVDRQGEVTYSGLSLFHTQNTAYTGNLLLTERVKRSLLERYVSPSLLDDIQGLVCSSAAQLLAGDYCGPFGVDMMIVSDGDRLLLHPCVEINLRRTMGHVALDLTQRINPSDDDELSYVMRIDYSEGSYRLRIRRQ